MNPPAPVKDVVAKKKDAAKPPAPPKAEEEDLDAVERARMATSSRPWTTAARATAGRRRRP